MRGWVRLSAALAVAAVAFVSCDSDPVDEPEVAGRGELIVVWRGKSRA